MEEEDIRGLLEQALGQFPVVQMSIQTPEWLGALTQEHWLVKSLLDSLEQNTPNLIYRFRAFQNTLEENPYLETVTEKNVDHGNGNANLQMTLVEGLFNRILAEQCGTEIRSDAHLLSRFES